MQNPRLPESRSVPPPPRKRRTERRPVRAADAARPDPLDAEIKLIERDGQTTWHIANGPSLIDTGFAPGEHANAKLELRHHQREAVLRDAGMQPPQGQERFKSVIKKWLDDRQAAARTPEAKRTVAHERSLAVHLVAFFGSKKLIQYRKRQSTEFVQAYVKHRAEHYDRFPDDEGIPENTARDALSLLKRVVENHAEEEEEGWAPNIRVPKRKWRTGVDKALPRWAIARLLRACRGWRWDWDLNTWETRVEIGEDGIERITRVIGDRRSIDSRKGITRLIRIQYRVAPRKDVALSTAWGRFERLPSFDVDDEGQGTYYRRGSKVARTPKGTEPTPVPDMLAWLLAIWKKQDGQSERSPRWVKKQRYVVRNENGEFYKTYDWSKLLRDAGLSRRYKGHRLKASAWKFGKQARLTATEVGEMTSTRAETLLMHYETWGDTDARTVKQAFDAREARIAWRKAPIGSGGEPEPARPDDRIKAYHKPFRQRRRSEHRETPQ